MKKKKDSGIFIPKKEWDKWKKLHKEIEKVKFKILWKSKTEPRQ
jgi:hypothetical protein